MSNIVVSARKERPQAIRSKINSFFQWINEHILCSDSRSVIVDCLYGVFALFVLFQHVHIIIYSNTYPDLWDTFNKTKLIFAVVSVILGKMWRDKGFWLLLFLFLLKLIRLNMGYSYDAISDTWRTILYRGSYAFFGCYSIGHVLNRKHLKWFIMVFTSLWTLAMVVFSILSIQVAWTGIPIENLGNKSIHIDDSRLNPILYCVEGGILAAASISMLFVLISMTKFKVLKILEIMACFIIFLAGALTVTRTNYIMIGMELAILICVAIYKWLQEKCAEKQNNVARVGKWIVLGIVFISVTLAATLIQTHTIKWFYAIRDHGVITEASAELVDKKQPEVEARPFNTADPNSFFTGRIGIWESIINTTVEKPTIFIWGESASGCMKSVDEYRMKHGMFKAYHVHNEYLQILLENGIVGLLLFLGFTFYCVRKAWILLWAAELPIWQRVIPITMISCLLAELVDCTCYVNNGHPQMTLLYISAGLTIVFGKYLKSN